jgi:peroxiredoxin Q/BCP
MTKPEVGQPAPDFTLPDSYGRPVKLSDFRGRKVVLYFYPEDDTPGCTLEACEFRDRHAAYGEKNAVVIGVSADSEASHQRFAAKYDLPFVLLADPEHRVLGLYGVWKEKTFAGRTAMGAERSTFIIDEQGVLRGEYRGVKVDGHVEAVLASL